MNSGNLEANIEETVTTRPLGISTAVQLALLMVFVVVLYELLDPHLGWIVSAR